MKTVELFEGISLLSGAEFDYNNPSKSNVTIDDIATALSNVCRFSGHLYQFYSVAQHAVNTSHIVEPGFAFTALMHDTAEAFTNDLPTPLKVSLPVFKKLEIKIESAMSKKFGFEFPLPQEVKYADLQMLKIEKMLLKRDQNRWPLLDGVEINTAIRKVHMELMTPPEAKKFFMDRFNQLNEQTSRTGRRKEAA